MMCYFLMICNLYFLCLKFHKSTYLYDALSCFIIKCYLKINTLSILSAKMLLSKLFKFGKEQLVFWLKYIFIITKSTNAWQSLMITCCQSL